MSKESVWLVPSNFRLGSVYNVRSGNIPEDLLEIIGSGVMNASNTMQFFIEGNLPPPKVVNSSSLNDALETKGITLHFHGSCSRYLISENEHVQRMSRSYLLDTMINLHKLPCDIIIHAGSYDSKKAVEKIQETVEYLTRSTRFIKQKTGPLLLFENSCGYTEKARRALSTVEDFRRTFEAIEETNKFGICFDTCHAYGAGISKWQSYDKSMEIMEELSSIARIGCLHLNDSSKEYGSCKDRHRIPTKGLIWKSRKLDNPGLSAIVSYCVENSIDMITEANHKIDDRHDELSCYKLVYDHYKPTAK